MKNTKYKDLYPAAKKRANARSYANTYLRRGLLVRGPCEDCGGPKAQMHHEDYDKPLEVRWMCRPCHLKRHEEEDRAALSAYCSPLQSGRNRR
jgi:hypothetical protein